MPNQTDAHVGTRLRLKRSTLGLTQKQLSDLLNCDEARIAAMEDGRLRIGVAELFEIATVMRVPIAWFFEDPDN
jgi:transcriptional regulator with XRE-family HTH domain